MKDSKIIRKDFRFIEDIVYLDSASVVPSPMPVIDTMNEYFLQMPFNYGVGEFTLSKKVTKKVEDTREKLLEFINAFPNWQVVFTKNTTEAINLVASGFHWEKGDEIIITNIEHQSNIMPWMRLEKENGIILKIVSANKKGIVDPESISNCITSRTKMISITHVSNVYGTIQMVEEIGKIAKKNGIYFMVDAAQSAGRIPIDVQKIGCDFITICGRKGLMGPQGTGALCAKNSNLEILKPLMVGSRAGNIRNQEFYILNSTPYCFESGVLNTSGIIGLGRAIDYINEIGINSISNYIQYLTKELLNALSSIEDIIIYGCKDYKKNAGIISWNVKDYNYSFIAKKLSEVENILVASGAQGSFLAIENLKIDGVIRTSVHIFNLVEDFEKLKNALTSILK